MIGAGASTRLAIAVAQFNRKVTELLLRGCHDALIERGVAAADIEVFRVPGAFELPLVCDTLAAAGRYDGVIALGAVIRGETAHFDFISAECTRGLGQVALVHGLPVGFGVLTTEDGEQALERADPARKNKGREAALAVLDTLNVLAVIAEDDEHAQPV